MESKRCFVVAQETIWERDVKWWFAWSLIMQGGVKVPNKNISDDELRRNYVIPILRPSHTVDYAIKKQ